MFKHIHVVLDLFTCISNTVGKKGSTDLKNGQLKLGSTNNRNLKAAAVFLPIIGWIIGALAGLGFYFCAQYFSTFTAALVATTISILFTRAVHEKGFAHTCDALTNDQQNKLTETSQLGIHGTLGLLLVVLLKVSLIDDTFFLHGYLRDEVVIVVLIFICVHALSRLMGSTIIYFSTSDAGTHTKTSVSFALITLSGLFALAPLALLIELSHRPHYILILPPMMAATWACFEYLKKRSTNKQLHCLGAVQQVNELVCFATFALIL